MNPIEFKLYATAFDILIQMELTFHTIKILIYQSIIPSKAQQHGGQVNNNAFFVTFVGLAYQCKDIVFRFIIKYNSFIIIRKKTQGFKTWGVCCVGKEKVKGLRPPILEHLKEKKPKACKPKVLLVLSRRKLGVQHPLVA